MSGDTTPKFPPEIFDAIIDHCGQVYAFSETIYDEELLGVFSLVSKSWFPRSRYHLFQSVNVSGEERTEAKSFLNLLDSPLCTFKPYVQILDVDRGRVQLEDALSRLSTLPAVRDLTIRDGMFTCPNSAKVLSKFRNLQRLVLHDCYFGSPAQLFETLSICTSLKRIGFYDLRISHSDSPSAVNSPPPSSLRFVQMHDAVSNKDMMEWVVSGEQVPAIETLALYYIEEDECRAIGHGLQIQYNLS